MSTNLTQLAEKRDPGPVSATAAASIQLKRFAEYSVMPAECSLFPAVRDLLANLTLPSEPPVISQVTKMMPIHMISTMSAWHPISSLTSLRQWQISKQLITSWEYLLSEQFFDLICVKSVYRWNLVQCKYLPGYRSVRTIKPLIMMTIKFFATFTRQVVASPAGGQVTPTQQIQSPAMQMHSPMAGGQGPGSQGPYGIQGMPTIGMMGVPPQ